MLARIVRDSRIIDWQCNLLSRGIALQVFILLYPMLCCIILSIAGRMSSSKALGASPAPA